MKTSMIFVSTLVLTALVLMLFSLSGYWAWAVLIVALLFAAAKFGQSLLSCVRRRRQRVGRSERFLRLLASLMGFFWVTGAMLYLAVFNCMAHGAHGHTFVDTEYLLHSLICSLELFMFEIDDNIFHAVATAWKILSSISNINSSSEHISECNRYSVSTKVCP